MINEIFRKKEVEAQTSLLGIEHRWERFFLLCVFYMGVIIFLC